MAPSATATIFVHPADQPEFEQFEANLLAELKPAGELQSHLFDQFLHAAWNIRACLRLEIEIQNEAIAKGVSNALMDDELARKLDRVYRHKKMHEAAQRHAMTDLRELQTEELWRHANEKFEDQPVLINTAKLSATLHRAIVRERKSDFDKVLAKVQTLPLDQQQSQIPSQKASSQVGRAILPAAGFQPALPATAPTATANP